jgi:hypothetical protein
MPVRCELVERELSARMDGAGDEALGEDLAAHVATCARCRSFRDVSARIREVTRVRPAEPVPDLVPGIMAEVRRTAAVRGRWRRRDWGRAAVAFAAGVITAAVVAGGLPGVRRPPPSALATEIPRGIAEASTEVGSYRASFHIVELGFHPNVPRRTFTAEVAFRSPERFRARITDRTAYPSAAWPRNNIVLAVAEDRWMLDQPRGCPREALPACAVGGRDLRTDRGRPPFDGQAILPTDIVLPVRSLAGSERVRVRGEAEVLGRPGIVVELAYRDATPLFAFLHAGGVWRPFLPHDRVLVTLETGSWFPLSYEVRTASGRAVFRAEARSLGRGPGPGWTPFTGTGPARDLGFCEAPFEEIAGEVPTPAEAAGLDPYRAGRTATEMVLSYAEGLSWLLVRSPIDRRESPALPGVAAERARLGDGGVAYYEPATATAGRRVFVRDRDRTVILESNLPRPRLLEVAASLPGRGAPIPAAELGRVSLDEALGAAPYALLPAHLPVEYRLTAATIDPSGVTFHFRRPGAELDGGGLQLFQAAGVGLPPPLEAEVVAVRVRGVDGRYSPARGELEWVESGVYRSLRGGGFDLQALLRTAESMGPV